MTTRNTNAIRRTWLAALTLSCAVTLPRPAAAVDTTRLWLERGAESVPLAQVPDFKVLAAQVVPAVVSIQVEQKVHASRGPSGMNPHGGQDPLDFFHRFFGGEMPREFHNRGLGSGFLLDTQGLILTNYHVVEDADIIEVTVNQRDGSEKKVSAKRLGVAPEYDVALLQAQEPLGDITVAYLGDSEKIAIGDWVMAVGNPFGLSHSASVGIISAKERREIAPSGRHGIYNFLQTDASINPGNSGGPLVNMRGEVIGINSAVNASGSGIGFAIPINMVKEMLPDLKSKGHFARSWIGIKIQPLTPELAQSYGLKRPSGALVAEVVPGGPAAEARVQEGDVVLSFDGKEVKAANDLPLYASSGGVGKKVPLKLWRDGKEVTVQVKLTAFPDSDAALGGEAQGQEAGNLGLTVTDLTPGLRQQLGVDDAAGAVVKEVGENSPAAKSGLRPGDLIVSVNGRATANRRALVEAVRQARAGSMLRLKVVRGGTGQFLALRKP